MLVPILAVLVAFLDQSTKQWVRGAFALHDGVTVVNGHFDIRYIQNTGAAFGMFEGHNRWLVVLSVVVLVLLVRYWRVLVGGAHLHRVAIGLMLGGVAGNLHDRIRLDYVVDFLDFYWGRHHFAAFNVADSAICVGVGLYVLLSMKDTVRGRKDDAAQVAPLTGS
jgi:signal peptidase II